MISLHKISATLLIALCMVLVGCSTKKLTPQEKGLIKQQQAQFVVNSIKNCHFSIDVDKVTPKRGITRPLNYGYSLTVKSDTIVSHLPYFGRAYSLPYGGGVGLNFEAKIAELRAVRDNKNLRNRIVIITRNNEDTYEYVVDIFDNGRSHIEVHSRRREAISFEGMLDMPLELL